MEGVSAMQIEVITQSVIGNTHWRRVGDVLNAVTARPDCQRFRFAVAYMRVSGLRLLYGTLQALCVRSGHISGAVGVDQGITTIEALELLRQLSSDSTVVCTVSNYIYHPKFYLVEGDTWACAVVGSANLTRDGLYRNVEFGTIIHLDLASSADVEIYQDYDAFLSELLNPRNPNVQLLNETTLTWLAEMVIVEDEAHVPEPHTVLRSRRAAAKLKDLFPSLPVPSVPTVSKVATLPNTGKETSAVPFETSPSRSHKHWALPSVDEVASIASTISSPTPLPGGKLAEPSRGETTSSVSSPKEEFHKEEMLNLLRQGPVVWNQWRKEHPEVRPDLNGIDLRGANLRMMDFHEVNLSGADLTETYLARANLSKADLRNALLRTASLYRADLSGADLSGADLQGTILRKANLLETTLSDVTLDRRGKLRRKIRQERQKEISKPHG
jgi:HKD family nuclease